MGLQVLRHLVRHAPREPPFDAAAVLAQLGALDAPTRARVKAMSKGDRERYARSIKN